TPAAAYSHWAAAFGALDFDLDRLDWAALIVDRQGVSALGVSRAAQERSARALPQHHRLTAFLAGILGFDHRRNWFALRVDIERLLAFREPGTGEKLLAALVFSDQKPLAALGAGMLALDRLSAGLAAQRSGGLAVGVLRAPQE